MTKITGSEFHVKFAMSKTIVFNVDYYTLGGNKNPYFATSADQFNRPKTDWNICGQAQNELLKGHMMAQRFFKKWNVMHLKKMNDVQYNELLSDLDKLFEYYPYILSQNNEPSFRDFGFHTVQSFSMKVYRNKKTEKGDFINLI